ncbi:diaminopimelate epimerase [Candidatus Palauibacter sp.]|uniref:diaminopimelate epimerase n=1 Tax=Candidatus Palauibacter sp. TaxID=3101350 RepID=UPI003B528CDF
MSLFSKYTGAGNDFVIVRGEELGLRDAGALAAALCPRATGVGVDGLITVRSLSEDVVRLRFFNRDGSEFSTCGNGSRCAARYAVDRGLVPPEHILVTDDGEILARVREDGVALEYALDARVERELRARVGTGKRERDAWLVRMGTAHLVIPVSSVDVEDFDNLCRPLRWREDFGPGGANVHLVARDGETAVIRTFERGVEAETLACGSGCMAAAFALRAAGEAGARVEFLARSGAQLTVEFIEAERIRLTGPAVFIFDGVFPEATR